MNNAARKKRNLYKKVFLSIVMRGWKHIDNFGESLKIYGKGEMRRLVDPTGEVVVEYRMEN